MADDQTVRFALALTTAVAGLVAFIITLLGARMLTRSRHPLIPFDHPNHRSLHSLPTARIGGVAITAGVLAGWMASIITMSLSAGVTRTLAGLSTPGADAPWLAQSALRVILLAAGFLMLIGFIDDHRSLSVRVRFGFQVVCAAIALFAMDLALDWPIQFLVLIGIVWMTNLYNFMDGADGLAASTATIGFAALALLAYAATDIRIMLICAVLAAASSAFLIVNWSPARAFLGDTGSIPLGFLAATLAIVGSARGDWPLWCAMLVFAPFITDATVTLLRRSWRREKVWQAHRSHYYQRLVLLGWRHGDVARAYGAANLICAAIAITIQHARPHVQAAGIALIGIGLLSAALLIDRRWARRPD